MGHHLFSWLGFILRAYIPPFIPSTYIYMCLSICIIYINLQRGLLQTMCDAQISTKETLLYDGLEVRKSFFLSAEEGF